MLRLYVNPTFRDATVRDWVVVALELDGKLELTVTQAGGGATHAVGYSTESATVYVSLQLSRCRLCELELDPLPSLHRIFAVSR